MRFNFIFLTLEKIKKSSDTNCCWECKETNLNIVSGVWTCTTILEGLYPTNQQFYFEVCTFESLLYVCKGREWIKYPTIIL